jgi:hypothetical protein
MLGLMGMMSFAIEIAGVCAAPLLDAFRTGLVLQHASTPAVPPASPEAPTGSVYPHTSDC